RGAQIPHRRDGSHGRSSRLSNGSRFCEHHPRTVFCTTARDRRSTTPEAPPGSVANVLIRFSASLEIAGVVVAIMLSTHSPADAQALKPVAIHAAQSGAAQATAAPPGNQYVGETTCITCHDQKYTGTAHGLKSNDRTPAANMGCESCHGPGKAHVDAGGDPSKIINFNTLNPQTGGTYYSR